MSMKNLDKKDEKTAEITCWLFLKKVFLCLINKREDAEWNQTAKYIGTFVSLDALHVGACDWFLHFHGARFWSALHIDGESGVRHYLAIADRFDIDGNRHGDSAGDAAGSRFRTQRRTRGRLNSFGRFHWNPPRFRLRNSVVESQTLSRGSALLAFGAPFVPNRNSNEQGNREDVISSNALFGMGWRENDCARPEPIRV